MEHRSGSLASSGQAADGKNKVASSPVSVRLRGALLFVLGLGAWLGLLYGVGYPSYHVGERARADRVFSGQPVQALVFGNSHGYCVKLDVLGLSGRNLSRGGQDMLEATYKARIALARVPGLSWVFIPVSLFHFSYDSVGDAASQGRDGLGKRIDMYAGYPSLTPLPGDRRNYFKGLLHPVVTQDHWRRVWKRAWKRSKAGQRRRSRHPPPRPGRGEAEQAARLRDHARGRCGRIRAVVRRALEFDLTIPDQVYGALASTVADARARGVRLVLFTPPYHGEYNRCIPRAWKDQVRRATQRLSRGHDAEYHDFHADPEFAQRHGLFANSDHLNAQGSELFSRKLAGALGVGGGR